MAHQADQQTMQLVLIRHGESEWNKLNLFTGWTDVELTDTGREEAAAGGRALKEAGFDFDVCYTSRLKRAIHTLNIVLGQMDREWLPVIKSWKLNERHYGALQGLNKADAAAEHGDEQVLIWRRSFDVCPPALEPDDARDPHTQEQYRDVAPDQLPYTECLKDTIARAWPYFEDEIRPPDARRQARTHRRARQLPALSRHEVRAPHARGNPQGQHPHRRATDFNVLDKRYIGDPATIAAKIDAVANQGKAHK